MEVYRGHRGLKTEAMQQPSRSRANLWPKSRRCAEVGKSPAQEPNLAVFELRNVPAGASASIGPYKSGEAAGQHPVAATKFPAK